MEEEQSENSSDRVRKTVDHIKVQEVESVFLISPLNALTSLICLLTLRQHNNQQGQLKQF